MKFLKYTLFIMIIFLNFNVFAADYNVSSKIKATTSGATGKYYGLEIYNSGTNNLYSINTRYTGRLSKIEFYVNVDDFDWNYNKTYTITLNMATDDWRNNFMGPIVMSANLDGTIPSSSSNMYVSNTFQFISMKKIKFNFKIPSTLGPYIKFTIYSTNVSSNYITGVSNWNLSSVVISDLSSSSITPTPAPVYTPTPTPQSATNQDVINANSQNTQDIINNQNQNTQNVIENQTSNTTDIIDNANANTESIIDNQNENSTCPIGPTVIDYENFSVGQGRLNSDGSTSISGLQTYSKYFVIKANTEYELIYSDGTYSGSYFCFYTNGQEVISCLRHNNDNFHFTTPSNAMYMRFSINPGRPVSLKGPVCNDWEKEAIDGVNQGIKDLNDSINNSSIDDKTSFFTNFNNNTHGLTGIITLPLSTIQNLANTSCVTLSIPVPFTNDNFTLPCMTQVYQSAIPDIYSMWQVVSFGIISYYICLDIFKMVKGFKDPNDDKVEVLDL